MKGLIFDIKKYAVHDGPGIRQTIFFKGCPLDCWWCHNPESRRCSEEIILEKKSLDGLVFTDEKAVGKWMTTDEVMEEIEKDVVFFDESDGGVTFSGGEPLYQFDFLMSLLRACREKGIHTTVDTTGFCKEEIFRKLYGEVDLYLYDLKLMDDELHKKYTGISNRVILKNLESLSGTGEKVILRFPVVPGITNTKENLDQLKKYIEPLDLGLKKISLLPYHDFGKEKYAKFNVANRLDGIKPLQKKDLQELKAEFEEMGYEVKIGG
jgi:pyruvate formate lyase activating enzyme